MTQEKNLICYTNIDLLSQEILENILKEYGLKLIKWEEENYEVEVLLVGFNSHLKREKFLKTKENLPSTSFLAILDYINSTILDTILRWGFWDYLIKPFQPQDVFFKIKKALNFSKTLKNLISIQKGLKEKLETLLKQKEILNERLTQNTFHLTKLYKDLQETYLQTIRSLAQALDSKDHYTHSHSKNVARIAAMIAEEMGLSGKEFREIEEACRLHDIGKISIEDKILHKVGKLTPEEFEKIKQHPGNGAKILEPLEFLSEVIKIVKQHHERYDGKGYPKGLKGEEIHLGARILAVADSYDAMVSLRPYRQKPLTKEEAIQEIKRNSGTQFDPKVVKAFLKIVDRI